MRTRSATDDDVDFLRLMGYEAATWRADAARPPLEEVLAQPHLARYLDGWGRRGDAAVIAEDEGGERLGAAWYRTFTAAEPGFGFLDESVPELSIAVRGEMRGRGIGTALLATIAERARADGVAALSLSVERENPAVRLYERVGFRVVQRDATTFTMRLDL
jgi:ribosomal protein S18 acetylase RimI-like enzyme